MKRDEIVQAIADSADINKAAADRALKAVIDAITSGVASGDKVQIPGLGTFEPRERNAREGRNPQTGETIQIAATTVPGFKAARAFKQAVAGQ
jgi:DNA-binding protein HU-beta